MSNSEKKIEDPHRKSSDRKGVGGLLETFLRRFRNLAFFFLVAPIGVAYIISLSLSAAPGFYFLQWAYQQSNQLAIWQQSLYLSTAFASGILVFWLVMILVVPILNFPLLPFLKPSKSTWYSIQVIPWYYHNALTQLVRFTVLDFLNPTPLNLLFFRLMGMKIGKGTVINTSNISDPAYITLDDHVTIGGSATLFAHYGMKGYLIVSNVHIKKDTTIGLKASVMGDVIIGEGVMVSPHAVILPKSRIEDHAKIGSLS
jgi:serine acetyltransferase